jgi:hypothetical protein
VPDLHDRQDERCDAPSKFILFNPVHPVKNELQISGKYLDRIYRMNRIRDAVG